MSIMEEAYNYHALEKEIRNKDKATFDKFISSFFPSIKDLKPSEFKREIQTIEELKQPIKSCLNPPNIKPYQYFFQYLEKELNLEREISELTSKTKKLLDLILSITTENYRFYNKRKLLWEKQKEYLILINSLKSKNEVYSINKFKEFSQNIVTSEIKTEEEFVKLVIFSEICFRLLQLPEIYYFSHHFDYVRHSEKKMDDYLELKNLYFEFQKELNDFSSISSKDLQKEIERMNFLLFDKKNTIRKFKLRE